MATRALEPQSGPVTLPAHFAPMPAVMRTLAQFDRTSLEGFISVAIGLLDVVDGDPDTEDNRDGEPTGDENDAAWIEWHTRRRSKPAKIIAEPFIDNEDDEADGAEDDFIQHHGNHGPGCPIGDPDAEHDGREEADEC
ncbi:MAG: hypothetical protein ABI668_12130 [Sphingorhabdus sp.]